jgi:hypothetical protein
MSPFADNLIIALLAVITLAWGRFLIALCFAFGG